MHDSDTPAATYKAIIDQLVNARAQGARLHGC
jgi:hypothetical protein